MLRQSIPFVDLRGKTPVDLLRSYPDKARNLIAAVRQMYGTASYVSSMVALPFGDIRSKRILKRNLNPYLHEIETMADIVGVPGIYALNICYEWGCTSGVYRSSEGVAMLRVLDWPFPKLGEHAMVVYQEGAAGGFYNVTWPGMAGVFNAMAPGRFSAAINQAPMRKHNLTYVGDWLKNRVVAGQGLGMPPSHLLRAVFENATSYDEAKSMLIKTPIAVPAIFTLAGTELGQGCVIERLETAAEVMEISAGLNLCTTNHFNSTFAGFGIGWRPREIDSAGRYRQAITFGGHDLEQPDFAWLQAPIINVNTRLAMVLDAASGRLMVQGYEGPVAVTNLFNLPMYEYVSEQTS